MELPERAVDVGTTTRWLADAVVEMGGCGDVEAVLGAAVRRTREAFDADAVAVVLGGEVVSRSGALGYGELARAVVEPRPDAAVAPVASALAGHLVVVRAGTPFTAADVDLIGVVAALVSQAVSADTRLRSERTRGTRLAGRLADLEREQALASCLAAIHRAVARQAPLQEVFDTVTSGARDLFGDEVVGLRLVDADDPDTLLLVSCQGLEPQQVRRLWRARVADAGASGLAVSTGEPVVFDRYRSSVAGIRELVEDGLSVAMAAPVRDNGTVAGALVVASFQAGRRYAGVERRMLAALADAVSLPITEAGTLVDLLHSDTAYPPGCVVLEAGCGIGATARTPSQAWFALAARFCPQPHRP